MSSVLDNPKRTVKKLVWQKHSDDESALRDQFDL